MKNFYLTAFIILFAFVNTEGATYYARASGNWSSNTTWSTLSCAGSAAAATPGVNDSVVICSTRTVTVIINVTTRSVTITSGGTLQCGGGSDRVVTITGVFTIQNGGTYIHNTNQVASTSIFAGTESFGATSTVQINKWSSTNTPLITGVGSNFGHLILNNTTGAFWNNNGLGSTRTIQGNFTVNGNVLTFLDNTTNPVTVTIGGKFTLFGELRVKSQNDGNAILNVGDTMRVTSLPSYFYGIYQGDGNFTLNGAYVVLDDLGWMHCIRDGAGNLTFNFTTLSQLVNSFFYGIYNTNSADAGSATFTGNTINYTGGPFALHYGCNTSNGVVSLTLSNNLIVNFNSFSNDFSLAGMSELGGNPNTTSLIANIGGGLTIGGGSTGEFRSNMGSGNENITINNGITISNGSNYFNVYPGTGINAHNVTLNVSGPVAISGGTTILSQLNGTLDATFNGATTISGGTFTVKGDNGVANVSFNNSLNISGGTFYLHNDTALSTDVVTVNANNNFIHSGGVISFCNNTKTGGATNVINLAGGAVTYGPSGSITRALAGTGAVFGQLNYKRTGTMNFTRFNGHDIQQVKQNVANGTLLDVVLGNIQVASHATANTDYFVVSNGGILALRAGQLFSNALATNSGVSVAAGGRLRTQHIAGLYNNSTFAAISNSGNMNYSLDANSTVEIYGGTTKQLTGINTGIATLNQHKYGILEINHTGAANTTWVYPTNSPTATTAIYIRTQLRLTNGELNLINSSSPVSNGGRTITIENNATSGIIRTNGYIKSEAQDFSGIVKWETGAVNGNYIIPFGYNSTSYIPMTLTVNSGGANTASFATYHTGSDNQPWPATVTNLTSAIGLLPDNRDATTDRYWNTIYSGTASADLTLSYEAGELPIAPYNNPAQLRAHRFNTITSLWDSPIAGQTTGVNSVTIPVIPANSIWAMANGQSPLPVELLSFTAIKNGKAVELEWVTASEKDNDYFVVERSTDLINTEEIGTIDGAKNSNTINRYSLTDKNPLTGNSYYRLRQVDIDGKYTHSKWLIVKFDKTTSIILYPNPASDYIYIDTNDDNDIPELRIIDISGIVRYHSVNRNKQLIDLGNYPSGTYLLQIIKEQEVINKSFIISR
jgi:Secretion system C-terminal sorting domain